MFFHKKQSDQEQVISRIIRRWKLFTSLNQIMPLNHSNAFKSVTLSEPGGSSLEVLLNGGQIISWKNGHGEELLFIRNKNGGRDVFGGISICFPQATSLVPFMPNEYVRKRSWSVDYNRSSDDCQSCVNLVLRSSEEESKKPPCRFELRVEISISPGKLTLVPSVTNLGDKSFAFAFALRNCLSVSDISEVRVEGLETLDFLDNSLRKERFTEQADALTFDGEINRVYMNTPSKTAIIDHGRKRTFVVCKQGLPDAGVWNPWDKSSKNVGLVGDEYKRMVLVDSSVAEKTVVLKPLQVWRGFQEISAVSSSYCSGQLDPTRIIQPR